MDRRRPPGRDAPRMVEGIRPPRRRRGGHRDSDERQAAGGGAHEAVPERRPAMKVVVWARVSSREQKEGYSLDAQLRANREKARREGWTVVQEFVIAESAKRGAERAEFNRMLAWVKKHARRAGIEAILSHKLDRVCRNMRDAVRLQELEDECGVRLAFVENQFGPGAAGALSFNVMAAVAQYYSDNLRSEVLKGMDEKVRQGWLPANAPFGYRNVKDAPDEPIQPDPKTAPTVVRIFSLYATSG
ncbi:MAG: recombinase family protein, partial [Planctomycetes bacterium]|nr:recombinase family protein [Planctomycetota bacterium]